jgi:hypothetical protein
VRGRLSRRHSRLLGVGSRGAGLVLVEIQPLEQLPLAYQQFGEPGLVLERTLELDAEVF